MSASFPIPPFSAHITRSIHVPPAPNLKPSIKSLKCPIVPLIVCATVTHLSDRVVFFLVLFPVCISSPSPQVQPLQNTVYLPHFEALPTIFSSTFEGFGSCLGSNKSRMSVPSRLALQSSSPLPHFHFYHVNPASTSVCQ